MVRRCGNLWLEAGQCVFLVFGMFIYCIYVTMRVKWCSSSSRIWSWLVMSDGKPMALSACIRNGLIMLVESSALMTHTAPPAKKKNQQLEKFVSWNLSPNFQASINHDSSHTSTISRLVSLFIRPTAYNINTATKKDNNKSDSPMQRWCSCEEDPVKQKLQHYKPFYWNYFFSLLFFSLHVGDDEHIL